MYTSVLFKLNENADCVLTGVHQWKREFSDLSETVKTHIYITLGRDSEQMLCMQTILDPEHLILNI